MKKLVILYQWRDKIWAEPIFGDAEYFTGRTEMFRGWHADLVLIDARLPYERRQVAKYCALPNGKYQEFFESAIVHEVDFAKERKPKQKVGKLRAFWNWILCKVGLHKWDYWNYRKPFSGAPRGLWNRRVCKRCEKRQDRFLSIDQEGGFCGASWEDVK